VLQYNRTEYRVLQALTVRLLFLMKGGEDMIFCAFCENAVSLAVTAHFA